MKHKVWSQKYQQANTRPRITGRVKIWRSVDSWLDDYFCCIPRILITHGRGLGNHHSPPPTWSTGPILFFFIDGKVFNDLQIHVVILGKRAPKHTFCIHEVYFQQADQVHLENKKRGQPFDGKLSKLLDFENWHFKSQCVCNTGTHNEQRIMIKDWTKIPLSCLMNWFH